MRFWQDTGVLRSLAKQFQMDFVLVAELGYSLGSLNFASKLCILYKSVGLSPL